MSASVGADAFHVNRSEAPSGTVPIFAGTPRHELKFVFPGADADAIALLLSGVARPLVHGKGEVSHVSSIYFDDGNLSACRESIAGTDRRTKVRLRWYDRPLPGGTAFFEIKRRENRLIWKDRFPIRIPEPFALRRHDALVPAVAGQLAEPARSFLAERALPTVLVCYERRHFSDPVTGIRITLDHGLTCCDQTVSGSLDVHPPVSVCDDVIVEVMTPPGFETERVRELLFPLRPRLARFSKYVRCCQALGWLELERPV